VWQVFCTAFSGCLTLRVFVLGGESAKLFRQSWRFLFIFLDLRAELASCFVPLSFFVSLTVHFLIDWGYFSLVA
jgi:hypothetical protein